RRFPFIRLTRPPPSPTLFPYTTLFRSCPACYASRRPVQAQHGAGPATTLDHHSQASAGPQSARCAGDSGTGDAQSSGRIEGQRRSEEHTSELQSHLNLVCRLLLEKKKK